MTDKQIVEIVYRESIAIWAKVAAITNSKATSIENSPKQEFVIDQKPQPKKNSSKSEKIFVACQSI